MVLVTKERYKIDRTSDYARHKQDLVFISLFYVKSYCFYVKVLVIYVTYWGHGSGSKEFVPIVNGVEAT